MSDSDLQLPPLFPHLFPVQDTNTASPAFISSLETVEFPSRSLSQSPMSSSIINHPFGSLLTPSDLLRAVSIVHEADNDSHVNQALAALPAIQRQLSELYEPTLVDSGILD